MTKNTTTTATTTTGTAMTLEQAAAKAPQGVVKGNVGPAEQAAAKAADRKASKTPAKPAAAAAKKASTAKVTPINKKAADSKAPAKAAAKKAPAKAAKAPAKAAAKKAGAADPVLVTKSGVQHPGPLWLKAMTDAGLSQTACANEMGVAPMTLNRLVNGHGIPTARVTVAFAKATKANVKKVWQQVADFELALVLDAEDDK